MALGRTRFEKFMFKFKSYRNFRLKKDFNHIPKKSFTGMLLWYVVWSIKMRIRNFLN